MESWTYCASCHVFYFVQPRLLCCRADFLAGGIRAYLLQDWSSPLVEKRVLRSEEKELFPGDCLAHDRML